MGVCSSANDENKGNLKKSNEENKEVGNSNKKNDEQACIEKIASKQKNRLNLYQKKVDSATQTCNIKINSEFFIVYDINEQA